MRTIGGPSCKRGARDRSAPRPSQLPTCPSVFGIARYRSCHFPAGLISIVAEPGCEETSVYRKKLAALTFRGGNRNGPCSSHWAYLRPFGLLESAETGVATLLAYQKFELSRKSLPSVSLAASRDPNLICQHTSRILDVALSSKTK